MHRRRKSARVEFAARLWKGGAVYNGRTETASRRESIRCRRLSPTVGCRVCEHARAARSPWQMSLERHQAKLPRRRHGVRARHTTDLEPRMVCWRSYLAGARSVNTRAVRALTTYVLIRPAVACSGSIDRVFLRCEFLQGLSAPRRIK
jgi:hypothetical protein